MKDIRIVILVLVLLLSVRQSYSQLWKQYADSAKVLSDQKKINNAIELYNNAREELKKDSIWTNANATVSTQLATAYIQLGRYDMAEPLFIEAKQIREKVLGKEDRDYANSFYNLAILYMNLGNYEKSEPLFLEAKDIRLTYYGKEDSDYAQSCSGLAGLYTDMGQYEKAEPLYQESKLIREKTLGKNRPEYARSCMNLASLYDNMLKYDKAEPLFLEAKQIFEKASGKNSSNYTACCDNLGGLYRKMQQYKKAEFFCLEANEIMQKILDKDDPEYAMSCNNLAIVYNETGNLKKTEPLLLEANRIWKKAFGKDNYYIGVSYSNLALLYHDMGDYEKAETYFILAKQIFEKKPGKEDPEYGMCCNNLANLYSDIGQYEKAEALFIEAKQVFEKKLGKDNEDYAASCDNLANLYVAIDEYKKAEPLYMESKAIREKIVGKDKPDYAISCMNLADLYDELGEYKKAESLYIEAKQIESATLGKDHADYAYSCNNLADLYTDMGYYAKAEPLFLEARQIRQKVLGKEHSLYAETCNFLANLYRDEKKNGKANDSYKEALQSRNIQVKRMFRFTNEAEKQLYLKKMATLEKCFLSFNWAAYSPVHQGLSYDVSLSNRNLILSSSRQLRYAIYHSKDTSIQNKYNEWISSREQISFWYAKPVKDRPLYVKDLQERANGLEKELTHLSAAFRNQQIQNEITWRRIRQNLKPDEAAIEFMEFQYFDGKRLTDSTYYIALILRKDYAEPHLMRLFEKKQLDSLLADNRNDADENISALYKRGASIINNSPGTKSVYNLVWQPIEKNLHGINKIYFAPAGLLHLISFAALPMSKRRVLSDKYRLVQLNTTASAIDRSEDFVNASDKIYLYGAVRYDADSSALKKAVLSYQTGHSNTRSLPDDLMRSESWNFLPGTEKEIEDIKELGAKSRLEITEFSGLNASEESIKMLNDKASPSILHIATHGFFFNDPKNEKANKLKNADESGIAFKQSDDPLFRSGLLLAGANNAWKGKPVQGLEDGILTSYEVSNLYLPNTKLVVLSACETGLGDIQGTEGVYGLQRAFKMAGVQYLLMSLWKVPDEGTAQFMEAFYKNLFAKKSITEAFYNAQTSMKNKYRNEPYKWAAWILVR